MAPKPHAQGFNQHKIQEEENQFMIDKHNVLTNDQGQ